MTSSLAPSGSGELAPEDAQLDPPRRGQARPRCGGQRGSRMPVRVSERGRAPLDPAKTAIRPLPEQVRPDGQRPMPPATPPRQRGGWNGAVGGRAGRGRSPLRSNARGGHIASTRAALSRASTRPSAGSKIPSMQEVGVRPLGMRATVAVLPPAAAEPKAGGSWSWVEMRRPRLVFGVSSRRQAMDAIQGLEWWDGVTTAATGAHPNLEAARHACCRYRPRRPPPSNAMPDVIHDPWSRRMRTETSAMVGRHRHGTRRSWSGWPRLGPPSSAASLPP